MCDWNVHVVFYPGFRLAQTMRYLAAYSGLEKLVFYSGLRLAQTMRSKWRLTLGYWNMQIQGPKTIGHMNTYISMLDFTSVPAWIILYCLTAGDCFSCLSANLFLSGILHCVFSGSRHGSFGVHARGPPCGVKSADWDFLTWFTPWFKRCGPSLGFF